MSFVDKATQAHLGSTLHTGLTPHNGKIADITHADSTKHTLTLAALGLPANAVLLLLTCSRATGTGYLDVYPNEGTQHIRLGISKSDPCVPIAIIEGRLQYALSVANDDFDLYCFGYLTSGRVIT